MVASSPPPGYSIFAGTVTASSSIGTATFQVTITAVRQPNGQLGPPPLVQLVQPTLEDRTITGAACTFLGSCVDAGVFTVLYRQRLAALGLQAALPAATDTEAARNALPRWLPATLIIGLVLFAAATTWLMLDGLRDERPTTIHAHRGVWTTAPENTIAAAREAIAIEGYRSGALSQDQVQRLLGLASRWEVDALLKRAGVYLDYTEEDVAREVEDSREQ